jgi:hypothetical protein
MTLELLVGTRDNQLPILKKVTVSRTSSASRCWRRIGSPRTLTAPTRPLCSGGQGNGG